MSFAALCADGYVRYTEMAGSYKGDYARETSNVYGRAVKMDFPLFQLQSFQPLSEIHTTSRVVARISK